MQKYKILKTLGEGNFGVVYKASNITTGEIVAIKKFKQPYNNWEDCIELREVKSLRKLSHPSIIKLKQVLHISNELYLVFEYLDYNIYDLYSRQKEQKKKFTENQIRNIVYQVVEGLAYMHKSGFFHRDMKPENLLMYNNCVKICDFGLAREVRSSPPYTDYVSTRWYRAPELLLRSKNYNSPVDIFALGCIMAELYTQVPLFPGSNEVDQLNKIVKILGTPDKASWPQGYKLASDKGYFFPQEKRQILDDLIPDASPQAIDVIEAMLQYAPRKRPTAHELLKHPYFQNCKSQLANQQNSKEVVLESNPVGKVLDTKKQDKKQQILKLTKQKFRLTREQIFKKEQQLESEHDLDSILKDLQKKINEKDKLPMISTKEKFKPNPIQLRESKTQMSNPNSLKPPLHQLRKNEKLIEKRIVDRSYQTTKIIEKPIDLRQRFNSERKDILNAEPTKPTTKNDLFLNKLNYNFQPLVPQALPNLPPLQNKMGSWPRGLVPSQNPSNFLLNKNIQSEIRQPRDPFRPKNLQLLRLNRN